MIKNMGLLNLFELRCADKTMFIKFQIIMGHYRRLFNIVPDNVYLGS